MNEWAHEALAGNYREVTSAPGHLVSLATARVDEVVAEFTERVRVWCRERGIAPHASLDIAASISLAMAASGLAVGPHFGPELVRRARDLDTTDGQLGLTIAAEQVAAYLSDSRGTPPLGP